CSSCGPMAVTMDRAGCSASRAASRTCRRCSPRKRPAVPRPSPTCCVMPMRRLPARPERGIASGRLLAAVLLADRGERLVGALSAVLRISAHCLLGLLRECLERRPGRLLEGGHYLTEAVGCGRRGARHGEGRNHFATRAATDDGIEHHVYHRLTRSLRVFGLEALHVQM